MVFSDEVSYEKRLGVLVVVNILSWIRGINYFRLFTATRVLVNCIKEVCKDVVPFMIVFFYSTIAFAFISFTMEDAESDEIITYLVDSYKLNLANYDTTGYSNFMYVVFVFATLINTIMMLNLLICIIFDTFSRVKDNSIINDRKELAYLLLEGELNLFTKRGNNRKKYLHAALDKELGEEKNLVNDGMEDIRENVNTLVEYAQETKETNNRNQEKQEV